MSTPTNPWAAATGGAYPPQQYQQPGQATGDPNIQYQQQPAPASQQQPGQLAAANPWAGVVPQQYQQPTQGQQVYAQQPQPQAQPAAGQPVQYAQQPQAAVQPQQFGAYVPQPAQAGVPWAATAQPTQLTAAATLTNTQPGGAYGMPPLLDTPTRKVWVGAVSQLIPPNYGIVDGDAFYVTAVVQGRIPQVGERVRCDATPNTDGGQYKWRCSNLVLEPPSPGAIPPPAASTIMTSNYSAAAAAARPAARTGRFPAKERGSDNKDPNARFNSAPPPSVAYMTDAALAVAAHSVEQPQQPVAPEVKSFINPKAAATYSKGIAQLTEEEQRRSEEAVKNFVGDPSGIGAKLLSKMGFGATEGSKGGLGLNEQGISDPVDPVSTKGNRGLGFNFGPPPRADRDRGGPGRGGPDRGGGRRERGGPERGGPRRVRSRSRSRSRSRDRSGSESRSRSRSRSPTGRYACKTPKFWTYEKFRGLASISKRYKDLYIPSDFCHLDACWVDMLADGNNPVDITYPFAFNFVKPSDSPAISTAASTDLDTAAKAAVKTESKTDAADATPTTTTAAPVSAPTPAPAASIAMPPPSGKKWFAKVMVFSGIGSEHLTGDDKSFQHPLKNLRFLVGQKSKSEYFTLGGAWDPVDGPHPEQDPSVLIKTAIRTFKHSTGVDLSRCTQWMKFAQLTYMRSSSSSSKKKDPCNASPEHTVFFLADAWSVTKAHTSAMNAVANAKTAQEGEEGAKVALERTEAEAKKCAQIHAEMLLAHPESQRDPASGEDLDVDPATLTVVQLQTEMGKRGLDTKWDPLKDGKKALEKRLQDFLEKRRAERNVVDKGWRMIQDAQSASEDAVAAAAKAKAAYDAAKSIARDGRKVLKDTVLTECLDVLPGKVLQAHKVSITAKSLESLLDYSDDDTMEGSFEIAVFSELFKEMLQTHYGRVVLKAMQPIASIHESLKDARDAKDAKSSSSRRRSSRDVRSDKDRDKDRKRDKEKEKEKEKREDRDKEKKGEKEKEKKEEKEEEGGKKDVKAEAEEEKEGVKDEEMEEEAAEVKVEDTMEVDGGTVKKEGAEGGEKEKEGEKEGEKEKEKEGLVSAPSAAVDDAETPATTPSGKEPRKRGADAGETEDAKRVKTDNGVVASPSVALTSGVTEPLIVACRFFDSRCAGYIDSDDLEELIYMVAPDMSRRQVQALVDAACNKRSKLSYADFATMRIPMGRALGTAQSTSLGQLPSSSDAPSSGFITIDGVMVDISSMRTKMTELEIARKEAEAKARELETQSTSLRASETRLKNEYAEMESELMKLRASMTGVAADQSTLQSAFFAALTDMEIAQKQLNSAISHFQKLGQSSGSGKQAPPPDSAAAVAAAAAAAVEPAVTDGAAPPPDVPAAAPAEAGADATPAAI